MLEQLVHYLPLIVGLIAGTAYAALVIFSGAVVELVEKELASEP